jgi:hypothetical protein
MSDADFIHAINSGGDPNAIARVAIEAAQRISASNDAVENALIGLDAPYEPGTNAHALGRATDLPFTGDTAADYRLLADHGLKAQCAFLRDAIGEAEAQPLIDGLLKADEYERLLFNILGDHDLVERLKKGEMSPREIRDALLRHKIPDKSAPKRTDSQKAFTIASSVPAGTAFFQPNEFTMKRNIFFIGFMFALAFMWLDSLITGAKPGAYLNGAMIGLGVSVLWIAKAYFAGGDQWDAVKRDWWSPEARAASLACIAMYATAFSVHFVSGLLRGWASVQ